MDKPSSPIGKLGPRRSMSNWTMLILSACLIVLGHPFFVANIVSARNITAVVGQQATLPCTSSIQYSVRWLYQSTPDEYAIELYFNNMMMNGHSERFDVTRASSVDYSLVIGEARLDDSGIYTCWEENGQGDQHVINLRVELQASTFSATSTYTTVRGSAVRDLDAGDNTSTRIVDFQPTPMFTIATSGRVRGVAILGDETFAAVHGETRSAPTAPSTSH